MKTGSALSKNRLEWIDNAKGIASLLVILGHVGGGVQDVFSFKFVYGIHLVMFFLISGYTTRKKEIDRQYINSRFRRLMLPYFVTCLAVMISDVLNSWIIYRDCSIASLTSIIYKDLLRSFFASGTVTTFGPVDIGTRIGAIWFLPAMFFASIIFQLMLRYIQKTIHLGIVSSVMAVFSIILAKFIWFPFSIQSAMMAVFFIWIGYEIKQKELLKKIRWYHYLIAQAVLLLGVLGDYSGIHFASGTIKDLFLSVPVGLAGCMLIYLLSVWDKKGKVLKYIGKNSLVIICTHLFMLETRGKCISSFLNTLGLTGYAREWTKIAVHVVFAILLAVIVNIIKKIAIPVNAALIRRQHNKDDLSTSIEISCGIGILLLFVTLYPADPRLNSVIYSMAGALFLVFSGYLHKSSLALHKGILQMAVSYLCPYVVFVIIRFITMIPSLNAEMFRSWLKSFALGLSAEGILFPGVQALGPEYFLLLLFVTGTLYIIIEKLISKQSVRLIAVLLISVFGYILGRYRIFLPWDLDSACFALVLYYMGTLARKHDILNLISNTHMLYFVLSSIWAVTVYTSDISIAARSFGDYGLTVIGTLSAAALIFKLSDYMANHLPILRFILKYIGISSCAVFVLAFSLKDILIKILSLRFDPEYMFHPLGFIMIVVIAAVLITLPLMHLLKKTRLFSD